MNKDIFPKQNYMIKYFMSYERGSDLLIECPWARGLLWLTLNLALIIQCLSQNNFFFQLYMPRKVFSSPEMFSHTLRGGVPQVEDHCYGQSVVLLGQWTIPPPIRFLHVAVQTQNKCRQSSMLRLRLEPTTPVFDRAKTAHALDWAATVIGTCLFHS
jgi:hypothetical protein